MSTVESGTPIAIFGLGRWGSQILRVLSNNPRCQPVHYPHKDIPLALANPAIKAVVIATPIETHAACAEAALRAGKHVFVEKPMTTDVDSAQCLQSLAEAGGLTLFVGHIFLHHPIFVRLQEIVKDNPVKYLHCLWRRFGPFDSDLILNLACHEVSLALAFFGSSPEKVEVLLSRSDTFSARLDFDKGQCLIDIDRYYSGKQKATTVVLEHDNVTLIWDDLSLFSLKPNGDRELLFESHEEPLANEMNAFIDACSSGRPAISDGLHGLAVVKVLSKLR